MSFKATSGSLKASKCSLPDLLHNCQSYRTFNLMQHLFVAVFYCVPSDLNYCVVLFTRAFHPTCKINPPIMLQLQLCVWSIFFHRSPAVQLHLCPDGRHAVRGVVAGWPVLLGAAAAAAGHRLHGSAARRPHPPLQSEASQTGCPIAERARRR